MKIHQVLCLCAAIAAPQLALADLPFSKETFGKVEGILHFCTRLDSDSTKIYEEQSKVMVGKASAKELAEARNSDEYKQAYDSINEELAKIDRAHAAETCKQSVMHDH